MSSSPSPVVAGLEALLGVRVVVRTPTVETFIQKYSRFVKDDRIFIFTKSSQTPGTRIRFTLELADGRPLVCGEGTVTRVRPDHGDPSRPPGMEVKFVATDDASHKIVALLLAERDGQPNSLGPQTMTPVPATLPSLPQTGKHTAFDPPAPVSSKSAGVPLAVKPASSGPSPLLSRPIAGGPTGLPRRPGGAKTVIGTGVSAPPGTPPSIAPPAPPPSPAPTPDPIAVAPPAASEPVAPAAASTLALARTLAAEVRALERAAPASSAPMSTSEPSVPTLVEPSLTSSGQVNGAGDDAVATLRGALDAGAPSETADGGEAGDELLHSYPGLESPAAFTEAWREQGADATTIPANPFMEVSDNAIEYFVEWSLERSTGTREPTGGTSFGKVEMRPPLIEDDEPIAPARRGGTAIGLAIGLGAGVLIGGLAMFALRTPAPTATVSVTPSASPSASPSPSPSASPSPSPSPSASPSPSPSASASGSPSAVAISSRPSGAAVTVDGEPRGKTPVSVPLGAGTHEVVLNLDRYQPYRASVTAPGAIDAQLKRPRANLVVNSSPPGADVAINGERRGRTPFTIGLPAYEGYAVEVSLAGGRPWKKRVYVKLPSTSVSAPLALPPRPDPGAARGRGIR